MTRLVMGEDVRVAAWMFEISHCRPMLFNLAVGIADDVGNLVGGIMFTGFNGSDAEVHYYGPEHLTRRTVRTIFTIALKVFNLNRLTIRTRKEHMARGVQKLGAIYEGTVNRLYGPTDEPCHAGRQYAFFRETIERLAGVKGK
jgi:hypothetical protein